MSNIKNIICCLMLLLTAFLFAGCHTIHGAGEDIERTGEHIERAADKNM